MAEYKDCEALIKHLREIYCSKCNNYNGVRCRACEAGDIIDMIDDAPAADVVHVIRCKDCKYSRELNHEDPKERQFIEGCVWCMNWEYGVFPGDYCSNAKRRKSNERV